MTEFWHTWALVRAYVAGVCHRCRGRELVDGFGLMGGGYGSYRFCDRCWYIVKRHEPVEGQPRRWV